MNRQKYLAELTGLLSFLTDEDKAAVMEYFEGRFDAAGDEGEAALIAELGTPMRLAISLNRNGIEAYIGTQEPTAEPVEEAAPVEEVVPAEGETIDTAELISAIMEEPEEAAQETEEIKVADEIEPLEVTAEEPAPEKPEEKAEVDVFPELAAVLGKNIEIPEEQETKLSVLGAIGFFILMIVPGLPLLAVSIVLIPALLMPVVALGYAGAVGVVASLKTLSYIPDAMFVFGVTLLIIAAAIAALLLSGWLIRCILRGWTRGVPGLWKRMARKESAK